MKKIIQLIICKLIFLVIFIISGCLTSNDVVSSKLVAIIPSVLEDTIETNVPYDFSKITVYAIYEDNFKKVINPKWYIDDKEIIPSLYITPETNSIVILKAFYKENDIEKTCEVKLNVVVAFSSIKFSSNNINNNNIELINNYLTPVLSLEVNGSTSESLLLQKLSFSIKNFNFIEILDVKLSDNKKIWNVSQINKDKILFVFDKNEINIPINSKINLILSMKVKISENNNFDTNNMQILLDEVDVIGKFFNKKVMENVIGLPIISNKIIINNNSSFQNIILSKQYDLPHILYNFNLINDFNLTLNVNFLNELTVLMINNNSNFNSCEIKTSYFENLNNFLSKANNYNEVKKLNLISNNFDDKNYDINCDNYFRELEKYLLQNYKVNIDDNKTKSNYFIDSNEVKSELNVGDKLMFNVINVKNYTYHEITAEVLAKGNFCYIVQEIDLTNNYESLTNEKAQKIALKYDNEIYPKLKNEFGEIPEPGIDNDIRVFMVFTRIVNEGTALGYFSALNQYKRGDGIFKNSNEKEVIFLAVRDINSEFKDSNYFELLILNIIAHEMQHMINWYSRYRLGVNEEIWVNEGLSMLAEDIVNYGSNYNFHIRRVAEFFENVSSYSLTSFKYLDRGSYGLSYLFFKFLYSYGIIPKNIVSSSKTGIKNIEDEIIRVKLANNFDEIYEKFVKSLYLAASGNYDEIQKSFNGIFLKGQAKFLNSIVIRLDGIKGSIKMNQLSAYSNNLILPYSFDAVKINLLNLKDNRLVMFLKSLSNQKININFIFER